METTARNARDPGDIVTLVHDACATVTQELHDATISTLRDRYARISSVEETLRELESISECAIDGIITVMD